MTIQVVLHQPNLLLADNPGREAHNPPSTQAHLHIHQARSCLLAYPDPRLAKRQFLPCQCAVCHFPVQPCAQSMEQVDPRGLYRHEPQPHRHRRHQRPVRCSDPDSAALDHLAPEAANPKEAQRVNGLRGRHLVKLFSPYLLRKEVTDSF